MNDELPIVTTFRPTADGKGRLFTMEPGKRVVLATMYDEWEPNDEEDFCDQNQPERIGHSPELQEYRELVRQYLVKVYSTSPLYQARAARNPDYWKTFSIGRVWLPRTPGSPPHAAERTLAELTRESSAQSPTNVP